MKISRDRGPIMHWICILDQSIVESNTMMSFAELKSMIPKIEKNVAFKDYLMGNGYRPMPEKNIKSLMCYKKETIKFDDIVYIGSNGKREIFYSKTFNDSGNIVDFVKNRIEFDDSYDTFEPSKDHLIEACKSLLIFLNENGESETFHEKPVESSVLRNLSQKPFTTYYGAVPVSNFKYFEAFKIQRDIVGHPIFFERIFNTFGLIYNEKDLDVVNTAFPIFNREGRECGLYYENFIQQGKHQERIRFFAPHSERTGLWLSNVVLKNKRHRPRLTLVENPMDAVSHFQYVKQNRYYASLFDLGPSTMAHLKSIISKQNSHVHLALNVTLESFVKEIRILCEILAEEHGIRFKEDNQNNVLVSIDGSSKDLFGTFLQRIKRHNNAKIKDVIEILGDSSREHLRDDLIMPNLDDNGDLMVRVPKNFKTMYQFEKILIGTFLTRTSIHIEKPMWLNWSEQNLRLHQSMDGTGQDQSGYIESLIREEKIFVVSNN